MGHVHPSQDPLAVSPPACLSTGILVADHLCSPIDRVPRAGELLLADELPLAIGGCASNVAMGLARLGVPVGVIGCVGRDPFGTFIKQTLSTAGVGVTGIRELDDVGTSGTLIINVQGEDRRFIHTLGANGAFRVEDIPLEQVLRTKVLYVGGYLLMSRFDHAPLAELFRQARAAGVKTVLDVVLPGPGDHWRRLEGVLAHTDVFLPNTDEAAAITGLTDPVQQAERFRSAGAAAVCITCGGAGTVLLSDSLRVRAGVYPVSFVGGTGAGDAFDTGYIAGLLAGQDDLGCLQWGSALGASCVRAIGATESLFTRPELLEFVRTHDLELAKV
jgi:sugar/nucleoside kinase (ribokinase family)